MANLNGWEVRPVDRRYAQGVVVDRHYLHRKAPCSFAFGLFDPEGILRGVVMYGTPSSAPLRSGVCGPNYASLVCELTRLWVDDDAPKNGESFLIGATVKRAGKPIIVSFAEIGQGHVGIVYQATNWLYTGLSAKRTNWTVDGVNRHCQTLADKFTAREIREAYGGRFSLQERPRKHRYVYFAGRSKRETRELRAALRYPVLPYPKPEGLTNQSFDPSIF